MIIVVAKISFNSEADRDRAIELSTPVQKATREQEPGCIDYCFAADPCEPTVIQVYESWEDSDSLAAHFDHPNYLAMVELLMGIGLVESINRPTSPSVMSRSTATTGQKRSAFFQ